MTKYKYCKIHPTGNWKEDYKRCTEGNYKNEDCKEGEDDEETRE